MHDTTRLNPIFLVLSMTDHNLTKHTLTTDVRSGLIWDPFGHGSAETVRSVISLTFAVKAISLPMMSTHSSDATGLVCYLHLPILEKPMFPTRQCQ